MIVQALDPSARALRQPPPRQRGLPRGRAGPPGRAQLPAVRPSVRVVCSSRGAGARGRGRRSDRGRSTARRGGARPGAAVSPQGARARPAGGQGADARPLSSPCAARSNPCPARPAPGSFVAVDVTRSRWKGAVLAGTTFRLRSSLGHQTGSMRLRKPSAGSTVAPSARAASASQWSEVITRTVIGFGWALTSRTISSSAELARARGRVGHDDHRSVDGRVGLALEHDRDVVGLPRRPSARAGPPDGPSPRDGPSTSRRGDCRSRSCRRRSGALGSA